MNIFLPSLDNSEQTIRSPVFASASSDPNRRFSGNSVPQVLVSGSIPYDRPRGAGYETLATNQGDGVLIEGIFQIEKWTIYGTDNPGLANTVSGSGTGAALNNRGTAQFGTFSVPGDPTNTFTSNGDLNTTNNTINVVNGALQ